MAVAVVLGAVVLVGLCQWARSELLRRRRGRVRPIPEARSLVRVLTTEDELREAVKRAVSYEEETARAVADRIEHYRAASRIVPVVPFVRDEDGSSRVPVDNVRKSA